QKFMSERTRGRHRMLAPGLSRDDSSALLVLRVLGRDSLDRRALSDLRLLEWEVQFPSVDRRDNWNVWVGGDGRGTGFERVVDDSAPGARISSDSARSLAETELVGRQQSPAQLSFIGDSLTKRAARDDHTIRWRSPAGTVPWRGADSLTRRLRVDIAGDS